MVSRHRGSRGIFRTDAVFVTGVRDGFVNCGFQGQRTAEMTRGITAYLARQDDDPKAAGYAVEEAQRTIQAG